MKVYMCRINEVLFFNTIFVSSRMYPENPEGTQLIVGSMNMGYDISDPARNRTHNLFCPKREPIPLGHAATVTDNDWLCSLSADAVINIQLTSNDQQYLICYISHGQEFKECPYCRVLHDITVSFILLYSVGTFFFYKFCVCSLFTDFHLITQSTTNGNCHHEGFNHKIL